MYEHAVEITGISINLKFLVVLDNTVDLISLLGREFWS